MSIFSRPTGDLRFTRLGWAPTLACGAALAVGATLCEAFPGFAAAAGVVVAVLLAAELVGRGIARERRVRSRLAEIGPAPMVETARALPGTQAERALEEAA